MTRIPNAYDDVHTDDKTRVQTLIPKTVHAELFGDLLTAHGVPSAVISIFLRRFHEAVLREGISREKTLEENETIAMSILKSMTI